MIQKLKESIDVVLLVIGIVLIVIALNAESTLLAQRMWLLLVAVVIEFALMRRLVIANIQNSRSASMSIWRKLAPGTLPLIAGMFALGAMLKMLYS